MAITLSEDKPKITKFLTEHSIGVLATADTSGQPHAATIYFVVDPELNVYFMTKEKTTKFRNLNSNPKAALAVFEAQTQSTVQISGNVEVVEDVSRINDIFRRLLAVTAQSSESRVPPISKVQGGEYKCFRLRPQTIRLAEYTKPEHGQYDGLFDIAVVPDDKL